MAARCTTNVPKSKPPCLACLPRCTDSKFCRRPPRESRVRAWEPDTSKLEQATKTEMYETDSSNYGMDWEMYHFRNSFHQHAPYKLLSHRRQVHDENPSEEGYNQSQPAMRMMSRGRNLTPHRAGGSIPKDHTGIAFIHNPEHPCGMRALSNVPMNKSGEHTNVRRDLYSDRQGLWQNSHTNSRCATIDRGIGTYSNLQGAWARIGPSTYDAIHGNGHSVNQWETQAYVPAPLRSIYDHPRINPNHCCVPIEYIPQNLSTRVQHMKPLDSCLG